MKHNISLNARMKNIELQIYKIIIRIIAMNLPHADFESIYFHDTFYDLERLVMETNDKKFKLLIARDFNLNLKDDVRDRVLYNLCSELCSDIANANKSEDDPNTWSWRSRRIEFILHSRSL